MASMLHGESRRLYSWWWDSHVSPKNSKWLQENLTDMDAKVKAMIKLIEEDADSFARRAEMYYKKRPELMKLVEEFYRAYRALAERYNHATGELRQAHRTMAEAFPNQVPFVLADDSPSGPSNSEAEPHTPEMPHPIRALFEPDDLHKDALGISSSHLHAVKRNGAYSEESDAVTSKKGLKQLNELFGSGEVLPHAKFAEGKVRKGLNFHEVEERERSGQVGVSQLSNENQTLKTRGLSESDRAGKAETEIQTLKEALAKLEAEKEAALLQYRQVLEKLSNLETEVSHAQEDARGFNERASKAETEVQTLKEALAKSEAEREASLLQYQQCLDRISNLESKISSAQEDAGVLDKRASKAETEAQTLKQALDRLEAEKEDSLLQYKHCLEMVSDLEKKILRAEDDARRFNERADNAETEVETLKQALAKINEENEAASLHYQKCLETISNLETEISHAQEETKRLNSEIVLGVAKLNSAEEQCLLLERSNQSLQLDVANLMQKMAMQNQKLSEKHEELERLGTCIQEERLRFLQAEAALQTLHNLHSQSQEEHRAQALELQNGFQMLKDMELRNQGLEDEVQRVKEENKSMSELNLSSAMSIKNLQDEVFSLREMKGKLEEEVELQVDLRNALQQEIYCLKEEINDLNRQHRGITDQVESVGLDPESLGLSVKNLQDENLKLKETCQVEKDKKVALLEKLENMEKLLEKNTLLENSLSDVNAELEGSREKVEALEESSQTLQRDKSSLVAEKATLVSQLEIISEKMEKLLEKNTLLENSLSDSNVELEGLREKLKHLEESFQSLDNVKSSLVTERDTLVSQLETIRQRQEDLEKRYTELEEKYSCLEKEKESTLCQVKELRVSLDVEKQERAIITQSSETQLAGLETQVHLLQEEGRRRKKEFEEELDKSLNAQVEIFILQKCVQDMEEKNFSLLIECQKHFEASKLSEKQISELGRENLEQQVEAKCLLNQIENLKMGIHQVWESLEMDQDYGCEDESEHDQKFLQHILGNIEEMKSSLFITQDEKQQLLVEKSVFITLLQQLGLEATDFESERNTLYQEFKILMKQLSVQQNEKHELLLMNGQLKLEMREGDHRTEVVKADLESLREKLADLQGAYLVLQTENSKVLEENKYWMKEFSALKEEKCTLEEEISVILSETIALSNLSLIYESFGAEKVVELKGLGKDLDCLLGVNSVLQKEVRMTAGKLETSETDNFYLKESVEKLALELNTIRDDNDELNSQIAIGKNLLSQKEMELSEAEQKLNGMQLEKTELHRNVEGLKKEHDGTKLIRDELQKQILKLSEDNAHQNMEVRCFREANMRLESELGKLCDEIEERRTREENLSSQLQERRNEVELWEAEAATFYGDLQFSNIHEALFEKKVHELIGVCESLEDEYASQTVEIEQLKERVSVLEGENGGLKTQLDAYIPVIVSLGDSITSLEDHALLRTNVHVADNMEQKDAELAIHLHNNSSQELNKEQSVSGPEGVLDLQKLRSRVEAVEKEVMEMKMLATQESLNTNIKLEAAIKEVEELKSKSSVRQEKDVQTSRDIVMQPDEEELGDSPSDHLKRHRTEPEISEVKNGFLMKDIPLDQVSDCSSYGICRRENGEADDQMLELWETAERDCGLNPTVNKAQKLEPSSTKDDIEYHLIEAVEEQKSENPSSELQDEKELSVDKLEISTRVTVPHQEGNKRKILERLASDTQKLTNLQTTVQDLKKKLEISENSKKAKGVKYETVKGQLQEVEEAIMQLVDTNGKLTKNVEGSPLSSEGNVAAQLEETGNVQRRVSEQARQGSEKIGRLQLEVKKIQFDLLKLEGKKESQGKTRTAVRETKVLLRDFLYGAGRSSPRRKKAPFCACIRPSTHGD
ncbi:hypothetical protein HHK36_026762 [Tetracentron sinense]|uniref:NAB domain-containing protein n=1 Tax=Tetracentron sinense TaxID=13715 RepID=A0A835D2X4_TETSI|nr:hypothetical protein HHK36_026762 [Tetracentron sinense]